MLDKDQLGTTVLN